MLNVLGISVERYDELLPWRMPAIAAARKRSTATPWSSVARRNRSWAKVRGWNAIATSSGTGSDPPVLGAAWMAAASSSHVPEPEAQARRRAVALVFASAAVGGSAFAAVRRCAKGLRSLPTPMRPSAVAWRDAVPRPENGSRTTSPGRL